FQTRETFADRAHHVRQQVGAQCRENAQRDRAGFGIAVAMRDALDLLDFVQHLAGTRDDLPTGFGQQHLAWRALHQRHAQLVFQFLDLRGKRRLADEAGRGGTAEMLVIGEGDQIVEITEIHFFAIVPDRPIAENNSRLDLCSPPNTRTAIPGLTFHNRRYVSHAIYNTYRIDCNNQFDLLVSRTYLGG